MIRLIKLVLLLALAVWIGLTLQGKMILAFSGWRVDMPIWLAFLLVIMLLVSGYALFHMLSSIIHFPFALKNAIVKWFHERYQAHLSASSQAVIDWKMKLMRETNLPAFRQIPWRVRKNPDIICLYAKLLVQKGDPVKAEKFIDKQLKKQWQENLVKYYGEINHPDLPKLLVRAEKWLKVHSQSAALLYSLGSLCEKLSLWGKAQRYLETSIALSPSPEAYAKLGALLERREQPALASESYKKGLLLTQENKGLVPHA